MLYWIIFVLPGILLNLFGGGSWFFDILLWCLFLFSRSGLGISRLLERTASFPHPISIPTCIFGPIIFSGTYMYSTLKTAKYLSFTFLTVTCLIFTSGSFMSLPRCNSLRYFLLVWNFTNPSLANFILSYPFLSGVILTLYVIVHYSKW